MLRVIRRLVPPASVCLVAGLLTSCTAGLSAASPDIDVKTDLKTQALSILRALFPDLSEDELASVSADLDLSDVIALRNELEAIRKKAVELSGELFKSAQDRVEERSAALAELNDGFPTGAAALGQRCTWDSASEQGALHLSGVFQGKTPLHLTTGELSLRIGGEARDFTLDCLATGTSVDVVFLIDITGSMSNVIASVRDSVVSFLDHLEASGVRGTVSVVTFQDSVGVNRSFQQPAPEQGYERSPFYANVPIDDASAIEQLRGFVSRLEANRGSDAPENLAAAIDFARNNVIGYDSDGAPNIMGDGKQDPVGTEAFPDLTSERQVFVALTDVAFHGDGHNAKNSSLLEPFEPRDIADILASLHQTNTTVHVSDPSWADGETDPTGPTVDADYWARETGGLGQDITAGYSLLDLELVVVAEKTGLLDITLDQVVGTSCTLSFEGQLSAQAQVELSIDVDGELSTQDILCDML